MFLAGFVLYSLLLGLFLSSNRDNSVVCAGAADQYYIEKSGMCVLQSASLLFSLVWIEMWSAILAVDTYFHITSKYHVDDIPRLHKTYFACALGVSAVVTVIPLVRTNLNYIKQYMS